MIGCDDSLVAIVGQCLFNIVQVVFNSYLNLDTNISLHPINHNILTLVIIFTNMILLKKNDLKMKDRKCNEMGIIAMIIIQATLNS